MPREKEENILIEDNAISFMVYVKGFFLVGLILFGMLFVSRMAKRNAAQTQEKSTKSTTLRAVYSVKAEAQEYVAEHLQKEGVVKSLENTSTQILGEATQAASIAVSRTTEAVTDYFYEHTLEVIINNLIEKLPERQKDIFTDRFCEKNSCT